MSQAALGPYIFIIMGPSAGVGKGTLVEYIHTEFPQLGWSVSATTRAPRPGEIDGKTYHFISREEFKQKLQNDEFLEYNKLGETGILYGTLKSEVERSLTAGKSILMEIEVNGVKRIKELCPGKVIDIFILPPSFEELERRLRSRGTETEEKIQQKLAVAQKELSYALEAKHQIVNDELAVAKKELRAIMASYIS